MAGYGTQYALDELDEGERIVDTPIPGTMKMNATPTVTKAQDPQVAYKVAANLFMDNCKALFGEDVTPADAKSIYRRMFGSETMTTENLNAAINRMSTYDDGEKFANDLLVEEGEA
jgi:hypothetical protein